MNYVPSNNPRYPAAAIKGKEQGTVILQVQVFADGSVGTIAYDAKHSTTSSADLIAAATDAVRKWHFKPEIKDGKPINGYARVPVTFNISLLPGEPKKDGFKIES